MKKVIVLSFIFIFTFIYCFAGTGTGSLFADEVEINLVSTTSGAGYPKYMDAPLDVVVRGDYAYLVSYFDDAFTILNVSNPSNPTHVAAVHGRGLPYRLYGPYAIHLQGDFAYIASHANNALTIFNISNPSNPVHVGSIESWSGQNPYATLYGANDVWVQGNYAYIASRHDDALSIIDVSNPYEPEFVAAIQGAGPPYYLDGASTVHVEGDYAYVTASLDASLSIFNISNPYNPTYVGSVQGNGDANFVDSQMDAYIDGDYAYVVMLDNATFSVINISNPSNPTVVGSITHDDYYVWLGGAYSVMVQDDYAYVGGRTKDSLVIINISDPNNPVHKKSIRGQSWESPPWDCHLSGASGLYVVDNYVYITGPNDDSLLIFDIDITSDAEIAVSPEYNFYEGIGGGSSGPETFVITNEGEGDLDVGAISVGGTDAGYFSITEDNASNQAIPPGQSATVTVTFAPDDDSCKQAIMSIPSNDIDENPLEVILTGGKMAEDFVTRFYTIGLGRPADPQGLDYWGNLLATGQRTGEDVGYGFLMSEEFINKNYDNTAFITILYNAILDRIPDAGGLAFWVSILEDGATRSGVLNGFMHDELYREFETLCAEYGIAPFEEGVKGFVNRLYALTLNRLPDEGGLEYWANRLNTGLETGESIGEEFIFGEEFLSQNPSDRTYIATLYIAFLGRVPELGAIDWWVDRLNGGESREEIFYAFLHETSEFADVCADYGIIPFAGGELQGASSQELSEVNIISITSDTAVAGDTLTIEGSGFGEVQDTGYVTFHDGAEAIEYISWSDTLIEVTVPEGAQTGDIYITTDWGISNPIYLTIEEANTIPAATDPYITPTDPAASDDLVAQYTYYDPEDDPESGSQVRWYKDDNLQPDYDDQLTIPSSATSIGEQWYFTVTPSDGTDFGETTTSGIVTVGEDPAVPSISTVAPDTAIAGDTLTIEGSGFGEVQDTGYVTFHDGAEAIEYISWSDTLIEVTVPEGAQTGDIYITTDNGNSNFIYLTIEEANTIPAATDPYITPTDPAASDDLVAQYTYYDPEDDPESGSQVRWYKDDNLQPDYDDQLTIPSSATSIGEQWYFTVTPSDGTDFGETTTSGIVTIGEDPAVPSISTVAPDTAIAGDTLTIEGSGFGEVQDTGYVTFHDGAEAIEYISWSDTQIEVTVPEGAQTGEVIVTTDNGTSNPVSINIE